MEGKFKWSLTSILEKLDECFIKNFTWTYQL